MAIRVSGLVSGLDTDSIVQELVSAYSKKKDTYVKKQTKLEWKMDAWKDLNKKVNSMYKKLGNLKLSSAYTKKTTTCSDATKALVSASNTAINGTQSLKITQVAKTGYITGAELDKSVSNSTKLSELGVTGDASVAVTVKGVTTNVALNGDMTVKDAVNALQKAGVSANYDEANRRFFVSAKDSGVENDFALTATDANGIKALQGLGIYVNKNSNTDAYKAWTAYAVDASGNAAFDASGNQIATIDEAKTKENLQTYLETIRKYQWEAAQDSSVNGGTINKLDANGNVADRENSSIKFLEQDSANKRTENTNLLAKITYANNYLSLRQALDAQTPQTDADGNMVYEADGTTPVLVSKLTDDEQQEMFNLLTKKDALTEDETTRLNELKEKLDVDAKGWKKIEGHVDAVKQFQAEDDNALDVEAVRAAYATNGKTGIEALVGKVETAESGNTTYTGWTGQIGKNNEEITANTESIAEKNAYINSHALLIGAAPENDTTTIDDRVDTLMNKINFAAEQLVNGTAGGYSDARQVEAKDAIIELNNQTYTSASNNITVNGLTITALQETNGDEITITTSANAQGMYDTIKGFLKQYNELIKEMDTLYNADSAKGYEPLTDDEKDAMTDKEIEKWEQKIKDAILRRDDRLSTVMSTFTTAMSKSFKLSDGKTYSLSSFGIKTQGYLAAEENEGSMYHIDGDQDDEISSGNTDKLLAAIQSDPDGVQEFFQQLTGNLYDELNKKMGSSTSTHSIYTIYNDKTMQTEYDEYTKTIKKWEEKVSDMEDYYYKKFSAMETALSKLQQSTSSLSGLLGTS